MAKQFTNIKEALSSAKETRIAALARKQKKRELQTSATMPRSAKDVHKFWQTIYYRKYGAFPEEGRKALGSSRRLFHYADRKVLYSILEFIVDHWDDLLKNTLSWVKRYEGLRPALAFISSPTIWMNLAQAYNDQSGGVILPRADNTPMLKARIAELSRTIETDSKRLDDLRRHNELLASELESAKRALRQSLKSSAPAAKPPAKRVKPRPQKPRLAQAPNPRNTLPSFEDVVGTSRRVFRKSK